MPICGIVGCSNRKGVTKNISFFKVPKILTDQGEETLKLSEERRRLWKATINRKDIDTEERWEGTLVCSNHFVGSVKAYLHDRTSPSWLPTLDLGYTEISSSVIGAAHERFNRASQRKHKRNISDAVSSLLSLKKKNTEIQNDSTCNVNNLMEHGSFHSAYPGELITTTMGIQTDLTAEAIKQLEDDNKSRVIEAKENEQFDFKGLYNLLSYAENSEKVAFYTGLPNYGVLKLVFNLIQGHMSNNSNKSLSKENEFLLCLVKLRMNYLLSYLLCKEVFTILWMFSTLD
ncbi:hypothetical protein ACJMK2_013958 [Sinanodonta woodiana]|uniref:THAP-type domain-containing protein n=1 Tax=Sinanodonta woodiana TaxID=1069815 RepID=A0ABD3UZW0_SINWO